MERLKKSDPKFETINDLANSIAQAKNPQVWFDINQKVQTGEIDKLMLPVAAAELESEMEKELKK
jgi:hypothetical protein